MLQFLKDCRPWLKPLRLRRHRRAAQRGQVHPAQPHPRSEAGDHLPQGPDHPSRGPRHQDRGRGRCVFVDTPGIHQRGDSALNRYLNRAARAAVGGHRSGPAGGGGPALDRRGRHGPGRRGRGRRARHRGRQQGRYASRTRRPAALPAGLAARYPFRELVPVSAAAGRSGRGPGAVVLAALPEADNATRRTRSPTARSASSPPNCCGSSSCSAMARNCPTAPRWRSSASSRRQGATASMP